MSVGMRGSSGDVGRAWSCTLLASCLLGKESIFPRRPCATPTRIPGTAIQASQLLDRGCMLAISDTMTAYAEHKVVASETTTQSQRVQGIHGCPITPLLPMYHIVVVGRGQTFGLILLKRRRPAEELMEAIDVLTLQKLPHILLVNHTMNVRLARPPVGAFTPRRQRVDVALKPSLHTQVALGVGWLLAIVSPPVGLVVVERAWWRLVVDGHHPCRCRLSNELGVLFRTSGHVSMC